MNKQVTFTDGQKTSSCGKNKDIRTVGLDMFHVDELVAIHPITTHGVASKNAFIQIPRSDIPAMIEALKDLI